MPVSLIGLLSPCSIKTMNPATYCFVRKSKAAPSCVTYFWVMRYVFSKECPRVKLRVPCF